MWSLPENLYGARPKVSFPKSRPFKCSDPECSASFTQRAHLLRHEAQHSGSPAHVCKECGAGFSRSDSLRRHERTHSKEGTSEPTPKVLKACDRCSSLKARCDDGNPCASCTKRGLPCTFNRISRRESRSASILSGTDYEESQDGRKRRRVQQDLPDRLLGLNGLMDVVAAASSSYTPTPPPPPGSAPPVLHNEPRQPEDLSVQSLRAAVRQEEGQIQHDLVAINDQHQSQQKQHQNQSSQPNLRLSHIYSASKLFLVNDNFSADLETNEMTELMDQVDAKYYVGLYFSHFHGQWPFLNRAQFNTETEPPVLVLAMVMCGLRITEEKSLMRLAWAIHAHLRAIFVTQMDNWTVSEFSSHRWPIATYQAILLFTIFAITANDYTEIFGSGDGDDDDNNEEEREVEEGGEDDAIDRVYPIFSRLVDTCRVQRILHYPTMLTQIHAEDPLVYKLTASEEFKYLALTLFKVDTILSKLIRLDPDKDDNNSDDSSDDKTAPLSISELQFPLPITNYLWEAHGVRELLRRRTLQSRDPSGSSVIYSAIMADDREMSLNREINPWICDILDSEDTQDSEGIRGKKRKRKAWLSLGPWLGFLFGLEVGSTVR